MNRLRLGALLALAAAIGVACQAPEASAAAEVHRLNLVLSAVPGSLDGGDFNGLLERYSEYPLGARGFEALKGVTMGWFYQAELRYFVRPNFTVNAGVGQIKSQTKLEFLPGIGKDIQLRGQVLSVPVHAGGTYYFTPYNQGDFQARAFLGGGFLSLVDNKAIFEQVEIATDSASTLGGSQRLEARGDGPGYYTEFGVHMFFAARYSVLLGATYRSAVIRNMSNKGRIMVPSDRPPYGLIPLVYNDGTPVRVNTLDVSGLGVRMALGIGF